MDCQLVSGSLSVSAQRCLLQGRHQERSAAGYRQHAAVDAGRKPPEVLFNSDRREFKGPG